MVDASALLNEAWLLLLLSLIVSALVFPFAFIFSFVYGALQRKYRRTPEILLMALCTFLAVFTAMALLELYAGVTLPQVASALAKTG